MAKKRKITRTITKTAEPIADEEMAYRIVRLYFQEIARLGFKRKLDLDAIINAYFYALQRLHNKDKEMKAIKRVVEEEERELTEETKNEMFPEPAAQSQ